MSTTIAIVDRTRVRGLSARAAAVLPWCPLVLAVAAGLVLLLQARSLVTSLYLNADTSSATVIASLMGGAPAHSVVTLGNYPWYEPMWFMLATKGLPHRDLWLTAPFIFSLGTALTLGLAAWRAVGGWAAAMVAVPFLWASQGLREILFTPDWHGALLFHTAILGAVLVYVSHYRPSGGRRIAIWLGLCIATAVGESDRLLLVTGIVPFVLCAVAMWWQTGRVQERTIVIFAGSVALVSVVGGELAAGIMRHYHVVHAPFALTVGIAQVPRNALLLAKAMAYLGGGYPFCRTSGRPSWRCHTGIDRLGIGVVGLAGSLGA
jgi:hypothetical protein